MSGPEKPKPNQEKESSEIEKIILEEFGIPCKTQIYAFVLPNSSFNGESHYDHLLVMMEAKYINKFRDIEFNGISEKYKIKHIRLVSSEEGFFY